MLRGSQTRRPTSFKRDAWPPRRQQADRRECCRPLAGRKGERARKVAAPQAAGAVQAAPLAPTMPPALLVAAPPALTTAQACALANAHAPYVQMGSASAGAAEGVFERESVLLSENRSPMSTQARPRVQQAQQALHVVGAVLLAWAAPSSDFFDERTPGRLCVAYGTSHVFHYDPTTLCTAVSMHHLATQWNPAPALAQELTRHAANLGMLAAATANPLRSKHFYLGFQAEHKLAAASAQLPCTSLALWQATMGLRQAACVPEAVHALAHLPVLPISVVCVLGEWPVNAAWGYTIFCSLFLPRQQSLTGVEPAAGAEQLPDLSGHKEVRMQAKVGVFGRGMASVKIQYFVEGQPYGLFKVTPVAEPTCHHHHRPVRLPCQLCLYLRSAWLRRCDLESSTFLGC